MPCDALHCTPRDTQHTHDTHKCTTHTENKTSRGRIRIVRSNACVYGACVLVWCFSFGVCRVDSNTDRPHPAQRHESIDTTTTNIRYECNITSDTCSVCHECVGLVCPFLVCCAPADSFPPFESPLLSSPQSASQAHYCGTLNTPHTYVHTHTQT